MKTLSSPLFEVNQESDYYKKVKDRHDKSSRVNEILAEVAKTLEINLDEFSYYSSSRFGFSKYTAAFDKYQEQLTKNADRHGIHTFKMKTTGLKLVSPMLKEIDEINRSNNPFDIHAIFGLNNLAASHWIEERLFFEVKDEEVTKKLLTSPDRNKRYEIEPIKEVSYKEYMLLALEKNEINS